MPAKLISAIVEVGTAPNVQKLRFKAPKGLYVGSIATATGIKEAADNEMDVIEVKIEKLLQSGLVQRLVVRSVEGTTKFTSKMLCTVAKRATVEDALKDKIISTDNTKLSGSKITGLVTPLRATFY
ncbi:hypothetical protein [uncultured Nostoc sp.]|uniref:hypothetical protein n=1 Tax=uncultured Nostoc sp. TaxID=340711 RepID=UPI0035CB1301